MRCPCPIYRKYCGRRRSRDHVGHICHTENCQWQHAFSTCTLHEPKPPRLRWAILHNNGTYFREYVPIGPLFGGTLAQAARFRTKAEAAAVVSGDWKMTMSKPVKA